MSMIERWPLFLREIYEFQNIAEALQPEFDAATATAQEIPNNFSIYTLTLEGIKRWESILGIATRDTETPEERQFRIISKLIAQVPYTHRCLEELLVALCGEDGYILQIDAAAYTILVKVAAARAKNFNDVVLLVNSIVPANMQTTVMQLYSRWYDYAAKTWGDLESITWKQMKEEVIE